MAAPGDRPARLTSPLPGEGDNNRSWRRRAFAERLSPAVRRLVEADSKHFLHQALSSPCLSAVRRAQGEDLAGRRYMDFHGNSVHHLGHGPPRLIAALKAQLGELPFAPRRFTNAPAVALAENATTRTRRTRSWRAPR